MMSSPGQQNLVDAYISFLAFDGYASALTDLSRPYAPHSSPSLQAVSEVTNALIETAQQWTSLKATLASQMLRPFITYSTCVAGVDAVRAALAHDPGQWAAVLEQVLVSQLDEACSQAVEYQRRTQQLSHLITGPLERLAGSIADALQTSQAQREQAHELAQKYQQLEDALRASGGEPFTGLDPDRHLIIERVSMVYRRALQHGDSSVESDSEIADTNFLAEPVLELTFPLLGAWPAEEHKRDLAAITQSMQAVRELQSRQSIPVQELAIASAVVAHMQNAKRCLIQLLDCQQALGHFWSEQRTTVKQVIQTLQAGIDASNHLYLANFTAVINSWSALEATVNELMSWKIDRSRAVRVDPLNDAVTEH